MSANTDAKAPASEGGRYKGRRKRAGPVNSFGAQKARLKDQRYKAECGEKSGPPSFPRQGKRSAGPTKASEEALTRKSALHTPRGPSELGPYKDKYGGLRLGFGGGLGAGFGH
jgi:hypothetical protein